MMVKITDMLPGHEGVTYYMVANRQDAEEFIRREKTLNKAILADEGASVSFEIVEGAT